MADTPPRLSMRNAGERLAYDRRRVTPGIVHLGVGAFHRAHMAVHIDDLLPADPSWGIVGASLRSPDTSDALAPQDFLYTLAVRDGTGTKLRVVGSILDVLVAGRQRQALLGAMIDPRIRIVSLTVTEKGYCHDPGNGCLRETHPDIVHDLADPASPVSAPGLLARAIELRRAAGVAPFAVLSCDNLPGNGGAARRVVADFAALRSDALSAYIEREVAFPSTMVDRIVPATTDEDRLLVAGQGGMRDAWPVVTEPFSQWVVEDAFPGGRPDFGSVGVELTADVRPFETMKLRMLNGSHSTLAYLGYLSGHAFVSEAIADPDLRTLVHGLMTDEAMPTLSRGLGDLDAYRDRLLARFANPALRHRTWQIAMDGSQKLPQRLLGTIRDRLAQGLPVERATLGVAAWMRYVGGRDEQGRAIDVRDPFAARLATVCEAAGPDVARTVDGLLAIREIFGSDLPADPLFRKSLVRHLTSLRETGALRTVKMLVERLR